MNCSEIDCINNSNKDCVSDKCILNLKLKRIESPYDEKSKGCLKCIGYESDEKCEEIMRLSSEQDLRFCGRMGRVNYIYMEDKE